MREASTSTKKPFSLGEKCNGCARAHNRHLVKWDSPVRVQVVVPCAIAGSHILVVNFFNLHHIWPKKASLSLQYIRVSWDTMVFCN